ncbi:MAG: VanZ family protein [Bacteroidota bacterium]
MKHSFVRYQLPAILWAIVIFVSSSIPSDRVPPFVLFKFDKLVHFGVYFLLAFFTYRAIRYQSRWPLLADHALLFTVVLIAVYGATDEFHQYFVPGRSADLFDLLADTLGACLLVAAVWWKGRARPAAQAE